MIRLLYSFGNNQRQYLYSKEIEPYKKAVHEMIFAPTPNERRLKFREVCKLIPSVLGLNGGGVRRMSDHESMERLQRLHTGFNTSNHNYPPKQTFNQSVTRPATQRVNSEATSNIEIHRHQSEERRRACEQLPFFGGQYEMRIADYRDIEILPDSIIYADKPYVGTCGYSKDSSKDDFDHESFWTWAEEQDVPVFISEYWAPEDKFFCIAEFERTSTFSATNNSLKKIEKIFLPLKWREWWNKQNPKQRTLFDEL